MTNTLAYFASSSVVKKLYDINTCGLYYKHITIVNDDSSVINKFEALVTNDCRVVIYDRHMFIVPATGGNRIKFFTLVICTNVNQLILNCTPILLPLAPRHSA
jgi:hypothetical protein